MARGAFGGAAAWLTSYRCKGSEHCLGRPDQSHPSPAKPLFGARPGRHTAPDHPGRIQKNNIIYFFLLWQRRTRLGLAQLGLAQLGLAQLGAGVPIHVFRTSMKIRFGTLFGIPLYSFGLPHRCRLLRARLVPSAMDQSRAPECVSGQSLQNQGPSGTSASLAHLRCIVLLHGPSLFRKSQSNICRGPSSGVHCSKANQALINKMSR